MNTEHGDGFGLGRAPFTLERRQFLKIVGQGVFVFFSAGDSFAFAQQQRSGGRGYPEDFNAYLRIGEDGRVNCYTGKVEMGQGIITALAQMLAEELEVRFESVDMVMGDTRLCPWDGGTNGSRSVKYFGPALRMAAAEAREVLIELAAGQLGLPAARLRARDGAVFDTGNSGKQISYKSLVKGKRIERHLEKKPGLKPPSEFSVCGKSLPRRDHLEKVTGKARYAGDIRLPGLLYARIIRPPSHGAKIKSLDTSGIKAIRDARIIEDGDLVAVLHSRPDVAEMALSRIKAQFEVPEAAVNEESIHKHLIGLSPKGEVVAEKGDLAKGRALATLRFEETYLTPYVAHAPMETHAAVADVKKDEATVWISTQRPFPAQEEVAQALGMPAEKVRVITPYLGSGFGGKSQIGQALEAARLSKIAGCPVQVARTREEEFFYDTFMPAAIVQIGSGLDASGKIVFWDYQVLYAGERSSQIFYEVANQRTVSRGGAMPGAPRAHPFGTGAWRGPGSNTNIFARESHIDVMAAKAGMDPLEFRLLNLTDKRMIRVLDLAANKFGWAPAKAPSGRGHGVACLDYLGTYVAAMAELRIDTSSGRIRVNRVVMAQDMGQVINPEGARMQMEGGITMGLGYALSEEIHFSGGDIKDRNFDTYEIPRFSWAPKVEAVLVDNPDLAPQGGGEPPITCMGALMANALFDATGIRLNRLPLTPERIKEKGP